jgi:hypothetical protein
MAADTTLKPQSTIVGGTHYLHLAPVGTTLPDDVPADGAEAGDDLDSAFLFAGATADTGAAFTIETSKTDLFSSQLLDVYRTIINQRTASVTAPLIDWSAAAISIANGGGEFRATPNGTAYEPPPSGSIEETSLVLTILDGGYWTRLVAERGLVAGSIAVNLVKTAFATMPITYTVAAPVDRDTAWTLYSSNPAFAELVGS